MSHLTCPLCGLNVPLNTFWNNIHNDVEDIEAAAFTGLGRGRGFMKTEAFSVLDDEDICNAIAQRCHAILSLLEEEDYSDLLESINDVLPEDVPWIDDLESAVEALIAEYEGAEEE